jgi:transposase
MSLYYAALDLHSNRSVLVLIDEEDRVVWRGSLPNDLELVLMALVPYREQVAGVAVESTYNWYWLVDGLMEAGYEVKLVNPAGVKKYEGLKHQDDASDAYWLAHLLRLGILPTGYIYPRERRGLRDLARKRLRLVSQQTAHILSLESLYNRCLSRSLSASQVRKVEAEELGDPYWAQAALSSQQILQTLGEQIDRIEKQLKQALESEQEYKILQTIGGVGEVLAATIWLETGDLSRFRKVGQYASYCRCVESKKTTNQKKKGEGNRKNGNKYLAWAWQEAAAGAIRWQSKARSFYQSRKAKKGAWVAHKALAHKLCRAGYFMLRDQVEYCSARLFG